MGKSVYRETARVRMSSFPSSPNITVISFSVFPLLIQRQGWICRQLYVCSLAAADLLCIHTLLRGREKE